MHGLAWFGVLGPLEVTAGSRPVTVVGRRQRELLAVLLLRSNRMVSVDALVDVVWRDRPPVTAHRQVRNCVGRLRRTLRAGGIPFDVIETMPGGYVLRADDIALDALAFARQVAAGRQMAAGQPAKALAHLRGALALWRGNPLADLDSHLVESETRRLLEERLAVLEECLDLGLRLGRHHEVTGELTALVREYPLRERLWGLLMLALYRAGRTAEALHAYREARDGFVTELGLEPGPELRALEQAILVGDASLGLPADLGAAQVEQPAPRELPPDTADFTDRSEIVSMLEKMFREGREERAVVIAAIAGQAGVGKTTLGVHVAHRLLDVFPDGQLYVNLRGGQAHRAEPREVLARFLRALGVAGPAIPEGIDERAALYRSRLAGRRVLVVLDNAVDGAQVRPLIPGGAGCGVLITSRSRLAGLPGARLIGLDVLEPPYAVDLLSRIVGRKRVAAEMEAARDLVRLCGGLPLALWIAGARLSVRSNWTLSRMAERLADEYRRLDELTHGDVEVRASLSLSYQSLEPRSRRLFHFLGLLDAPDLAGWVCAALLDTTVPEADATIDALVDAQLLEPAGQDAIGQPRYRLHDLVRLYAWERAAEAEPPAERRAAITRALGGWLALAELAHTTLSGGDFAILHGTAARWRPAIDELGDLVRADPLAWYDTERLNIVLGVRQAADAGLDELSWDLSASAYSLFLTRGHNEYWADTMARALAATRRNGNRRGSAAMLLGLGLLDAYRHRYTDAATGLDEAVRTFREIGDQIGLTHALGVAAHVDGMRGRYDDAVARHEELLEVHRARGDRGAETMLSRSLGQLLIDIGRPEKARPFLEQALAAGREGDRRARAEVLYWLGQLHLACDDIDRAEATFSEMFTMATEIGDPRGQAEARYGLGLVRLETGALGAAAALFQQALALNEPLAEPLMDGRIRIALGTLHRRLGDSDRAAEHLAAAAQIFAAIETPLWQARALSALAEVHADRGAPADAQTARGQARILFALVGIEPPTA